MQVSAPHRAEVAAQAGVDAVAGWHGNASRTVKDGKLTVVGTVREFCTFIAERASADY